MPTRLIAFAVLPLAAAFSTSAQSPKSVREFGTLQNNVYHHHATTQPAWSSLYPRDGTS